MINGYDEIINCFTYLASYIFSFPEALWCLSRAAPKPCVSLLIVIEPFGGGKKASVSCNYVMAGILWVVWLGRRKTFEPHLKESIFSL